jgi:hypothetical protein
VSKLRDVVVVRVSEKGDREDEHFHSPEVQIEAAMRWAKDRGERLAVSPIPEIDVSGRLPLSKRPGLLAAIGSRLAGPTSLWWRISIGWCARSRFSWR